MVSSDRTKWQLMQIKTQEIPLKDNKLVFCFVLLQERLNRIRLPGVAVKRPMWKQQKSDWEQP